MDMLADVDLNFEDAKGARNWFNGSCTRAKLTGSLSSGASSICRCVYNARDSGNSSRAVLFNVNNNGTLTVPSFFKTFELKVSASLKEVLMRLSSLSLYFALFVFLAICKMFHPSLDIRCI